MITFGIEAQHVVSAYYGISIGCSIIILFYEGDALFHVAYFGEIVKVAECVEYFVDDIMS